MSENLDSTNDFLTWAPHASWEQLSRVVDKAWENFVQLDDLPMIDAERLARLVILCAGGKPENVENKHIDEQIELIARCQWRIELAKAQCQLGLMHQCVEPEMDYVRSRTFPEIWETIKDKLEIDFQTGLRFLIPEVSENDEGENTDERRRIRFLKFFGERFETESKWGISWRNLVTSFRLTPLEAAQSTKDGNTPSGEEKSRKAQIQERFTLLEQRGWGKPDEFMDWFRAYKEWWSATRSEINRRNRVGKTRQTKAKGKSSNSAVTVSGDGKKSAGVKSSKKKSARAKGSKKN